MNIETLSRIVTIDASIGYLTNITNPEGQRVLLEISKKFRGSDDQNGMGSFSIGDHQMHFLADSEPLSSFGAFLSFLCENHKQEGLGFSEIEGRPLISTKPTSGVVLVAAPIFGDGNGKKGLIDIRFHELEKSRGKFFVRGNLYRAVFFKPAQVH